jgi:hypothetical protein
MQRHVRGQVGEQVVGEVTSGVRDDAGCEAGSDEEPQWFGGQHVEAKRLEAFINYPLVLLRYSQRK